MWSGRGSLPYLGGSGVALATGSREFRQRYLALPKLRKTTRFQKLALRFESQALPCDFRRFAVCCFPPASPAMLHLRGEADLVDVARLRPSGRSNEKEGEV